MVNVMKFRAVIPERNVDAIHFTLADVASPLANFSIREIVIPWLLVDNIPDVFISKCDKNNVEIYTNDIVKQVFNGKVEVGVVTFSPTQGYTISGKGIWLHDIEVVGNVHDNPEYMDVIRKQASDEIQRTIDFMESMDKLYDRLKKAYWWELDKKRQIKDEIEKLKTEKKGW